MQITEKLKLKQNMSQGEKIVADYFLKLNEKIEIYSTRMIANETYTSPSTAIRLSKKLGYSGFEEFKKAFLKELSFAGGQINDINVNYPFDSTDSFMKTANRIYQLYEHTVSDNKRLLNHDELQNALKYIQRSNSIYIFSYSVAINIAEIFKEQMSKIEKRVIISSTSWSQSYELRSAQKGDIAILISYSGETEWIIKLAEDCRRRSIPIICISKVGDTRLTRLADCKLSIPAREDLHDNLGFFETTLSIQMILGVLYASYFSLNYEQNIFKKESNHSKIVSNK